MQNLEKYTGLTIFKQDAHARFYNAINNNRQAVVLKAYKKKIEHEELISETKNLINLKGENITKILEVINEARIINQGQTLETSILVLQHKKGFIIKQYLDEYKKFSQEEALYLFGTLINTFGRMAKQNYLPKKINIDNVIISSQHKLKIVDYSLKNSESNEQGLMGAGVLLFNMCTGFSPFASNQVGRRCKNWAQKNDWEKFWSFFESKQIRLSEHVKQLFSVLMNKNATLQDIKQLSWVQYAKFKEIYDQSFKLKENTLIAKHAQLKKRL